MQLSWPIEAIEAPYSSSPDYFAATRAFNLRNTLTTGSLEAGPQELDRVIDHWNHPEIDLAVNPEKANGDAVYAYTHRTLFEKLSPYVHTTQPACQDSKADTTPTHTLRVDRATTRCRRTRSVILIGGC